MKDKTIAIGIWFAIGLVAAGLLIAVATGMFATTQDGIIKNAKQVEHY
jgi:hypothetical protein